MKIQLVVVVAVTTMGEPILSTEVVHHHQSILHTYEQMLPCQRYEDQLPTSLVVAVELLVEVHPRDLFDLHYVNPWALSLNP